jgi:hypothetical protein
MIIRPGDKGWRVDSWYDVSEHRLEYIRAKILNKKPPDETLISLFAWRLRARYNMGEVLHIRSPSPLTREIVEQMVNDGGDEFIRRFRCRV